MAWKCFLDMALCHDLSLTMSRLHVPDVDLALLNGLSSKMELHSNVLGTSVYLEYTGFLKFLMHPWLFQWIMTVQGAHPSSSKKYWSQAASLITALAAMKSASTVEEASRWPQRFASYWTMRLPHRIQKTQMMPYRPYRI